MKREKSLSSLGTWTSLFWLHTEQPNLCTAYLFIKDEYLINKQRKYYVRFEVFTAVTMKNAVFWDVTPCRSCVSRRFRGTYHLHLQDRKIRKRGTNVSRWLQTEPPVGRIGVFDWWLSLQPPAHTGFSLEDYSTLKIEAIYSSETWVHTRSTRRHIPEDGILQRKYYWWVVLRSLICWQYSACLSLQTHSRTGGTYSYPFMILLGSYIFIQGWIVCTVSDTSLAVRHLQTLTHIVIRPLKTLIRDISRRVGRKE
jgi:hypothetical protein